MRLPKRPVGLFYPGHSGRRFSASDMPLLRNMRVGFGEMLEHAAVMRSRETDPGMLLALGVVMGQLRGWYDAVGDVLGLLERTPPGWRP